MTDRLKVLVPSSANKLRISDELAGRLDAGDGGVCTALVVNSFGKIWHVEVGRDSDGAFLGHGWSEFVGAHGIGVGWLLVLRHEGRCVLTVKAFDTAGCLKEFGRSLTVAATRSSTGGARRPQFIKVLEHSFVRKMPIPAEFVQRYISEEQLSNQMAIVSIPPSKYRRIELEKDQSNVFFAGGWAQFLEFHGITERNYLLLKYEGNMVFTVKVFGPKGCQKEFKDRVGGIETNEKSRETKMESQQETPSSSSKRECKDEMPSAKDKKRPKISKVSVQKESSPVVSRCVYEFGPPSWIKKEINTVALERQLSLTSSFCNEIGFREHCTITLKTSMDSTRSWQVHGLAYGNSCHQLGQGWKTFCQDNGIKEGDWCTFNIIEATLWHVVIVDNIE